MGQSAVIMAFRKRLKKRGYTNVSIKQKRDKLRHRVTNSDGYYVYVVIASEPLTGSAVSGEFSSAELSALMR